MKTVLISTDGEVPAALREIIAGGSTTLVEYRAAELAGSAQPIADRVVFWSRGEEPAVPELAATYTGSAAAAARDRILFIRAERGASPHPPLAPEQVFTWPYDEDRLKMTFLTGA